MRPLWASSILRVSWKSSTIGKCPRCEAGRTVGTGAPRFSSRSTTGGGVSTRAARHMQGFGRFGRSRRGGGTGAFPALTSIRAKRRQAHERKEADMDENGKRRTMRGGCSGRSIPARRGRGGVLNVAHGRLHGADATGGDDGRLGSSHTRGRGDRALQVAAIWPEDATISPN